MDGNAITKVVTHYMAAWNEREAAARDTLLEACWSDGGVYLDPNVSLTGREALARTSPRFRPAGPARGSRS